MHRTSGRSKSTSRAQVKVDSVSSQNAILNGAKVRSKSSTSSKILGEEVHNSMVRKEKKILVAKKLRPRTRVQVVKGKVGSTTPIILLCGYLGSGKTTVLSHLLSLPGRPRVAVLMNEFGEVGVDTAIIQGRNVHVKELLEGCVCCSLVGEFKAAVQEIIHLYHPDYVVVETTGIAEADNLILDTSSIPGVTLHSIVSVVDAHLVWVAQQLGHNIEVQIKAADLLILNKVDLVPWDIVLKIQQRLREMNSRALLISTIDGHVGWDIVLGLKHSRLHSHQVLARNIVKAQSVPLKHDLVHVAFHIDPMQRTLAEWNMLLQHIPVCFERVKGVIAIGKSSYLLNYVRGHYTFKRISKPTTGLVVIGKNITFNQIRAVFG